MCHLHLSKTGRYLLNWCANLLLFLDLESLCTGIRSGLLDGLVKLGLHLLVLLGLWPCLGVVLLVLLGTVSFGWLKSSE